MEGMMKRKAILFISLFCIIGASFGVTDYVSRLNRSFSRSVARAINFGYMLRDMNSLLRGGKVLVSDPALAAGTSDTAKVKAAAFKAWNAGGYISFPALETAFTATTHDIASGKYATYRLGKDFDDSLAVVIMSASTYTTKDSALTAVPACPDSLLNIGYLMIYASGGAFDATTTKLNASTLTVEYNDANNYVMDLTQ